MMVAGFACAILFMILGFKMEAELNREIEPENRIPFDRSNALRFLREHERRFPGSKIRVWHTRLFALVALLFFGGFFLQILGSVYEF